MRCSASYKLHKTITKHTIDAHDHCQNMVPAHSLTP